MSCNNKTSKINSPLVSIIKLQSSEALEDFEEARKYQDITNLYGEYAKEMSVSPEKYWMDHVKSNNMLARDKKFTSQIKYYNYNIEEVINGKLAEVIFSNKIKSDRVRSIIYELKLTDSKWILHKISYNVNDQ
jgi:hypothetical protein